MEMAVQFVELVLLCPLLFCISWAVSNCYFKCNSFKMLYTGATFSNLTAASLIPSIPLTASIFKFLNGTDLPVITS